ncbi:MAG: hypothetical protein HYS12_08415 [Planctomycetes bacterium]|nr:hypothetical protein [Planctomycetota bacterium]
MFYQKLVFLIPTLTILDINVDSASSVAEIRARPTGMFAFLLSLIGFGKTYNYRIDAEGWTETTTSASGETHSFVPWTHISSCVFSISQFPILSFLFKKKAKVAITTDGGTAETILTQPSGNQLEWLKELYELISTLVREGGGVTAAAPPAGRRAPAADHQPAPHRAPAAAPAPAVAPASAEPKVCNCPHCNARMRVPANAVGKRATCPSCQQQFQLS